MAFIKCQYTNDYLLTIKEKIFEDYFTEIQADMVSICLEYGKRQIFLRIF